MLQWLPFAGLAIAIILALLFGVLWYVGWSVAISVITFALYGWDKARAKTHGWRVSEATLHACGLAGGAIGGWAGMLFFRHKSQHAIFKLTLTIGLLLQIAVLLVLLSGQIGRAG
jgi:uncharacterized membrane protein YsdA (DUF1294 family)